MKKAILKNMKKFLLEIGRDFIFMGEEYHLQVGKNDYYTDYSDFNIDRLRNLYAVYMN